MAKSCFFYTIHESSQSTEGKQLLQLATLIPETTASWTRLLKIRNTLNFQNNGHIKCLTEFKQVKYYQRTLENLGLLFAGMSPCLQDRRFLKEEIWYKVTPTALQLEPCQPNLNLFYVGFSLSDTLKMNRG